MRSSKAMISGMAVVALVGALLLQVGQAPRFAEAQGEKMGESGAGVYLATDRPSYSAGQPINMELRVFSRTEEKAAFQFRNGQRFDFVIKDARGKEIWRWSQDRMFTMALGTEVLGPGRPEVVYRNAYTGRLAPGTYQLTGTITASNRPTSATLTVQVR